MPESASRGGVCSWEVSAGRCLLQGVSALEGCMLGGDVCSWGCLLPGGHLLPGVSAPGRYLLQGVSAPGSVCSQGSAPGGLLPGSVVSQHALRQTPHPPPVNRMTDRCKNITLATTSLWPVINDKQQRQFSLSLPFSFGVNEPLRYQGYLINKWSCLVTA